MCDFDYITAHVLTEFEEQMKLTLQPMVWHGEGDVFTHTMMVADAWEL